jgi:hypothetical protein
MYDILAQARWGVDHWSLLAYIETRCVDGAGGVGRIEKRHFRCNPERHPQHLPATPFGWEPIQGTRLAGYSEAPKQAEPADREALGVQLLKHDDWDCLADLAAAGYLEVTAPVRGEVRLTDKGTEIALKISEHKGKGGKFSTFHHKDAVPA